MLVLLRAGVVLVLSEEEEEGVSLEISALRKVIVGPGEGFTVSAFLPFPYLPIYISPSSMHLRIKQRKGGEARGQLTIFE